MRRFKKAFFTKMVMILLAVPLLLPGPALAATPNPAPGSAGYMVLPLQFSRTITATATPITFKAPFPCAVIGVTAHAKTLDFSSTDETYTVDVKEGANSILSSAISLAAAGTIYDGTLSDTAIADEATVSVVVTLGGTTPSLTDLTVLLVLKRL